jgi:hypothetical protein
MTIKRCLWIGCLIQGWLLGCACSPRSQEAAGDQRGASRGAVVPSRVSASDLVVLRPAAGETWREGQNYTIHWRARNIVRVNVGLALGGKDKGHAVLDYPASADSLHWRVPRGFVSGFGLRRSDDVRVRVEDARDPTQFADSPSFTIVAEGQDSSAR